MRNSRLLRVFGLVAFLLAMVHTSVWGGHGNTTHYGKVTVSKTGEGTVYISTSNNATSGNMEESWDCEKKEDNDSKTFYLFATPADGYMFKGWEGPETPSGNPCKITPEAASTNSGSPTPFDYTANFEKVLCSATVKVAADGGTATVDGEQSSTKQSSASKDTFTFKLEATANEGYKFKGWADSLEGNITYTDNPLTLDITCDTEVDEELNKTEYWFAIFEQEGQTEEDETKYINPILDADTEDPSVILAQDGFYYLYSSEMKEGEGMPVWRSADLVNWTCITYIFASRPNGVSESAKLLSPDIAYVNGKYLLYYSCARSSDDKTQIHVATSDKPYGPFSSDKALITVDDAKTPSLFQDTDGKNYLVFGEMGMGIRYIGLDAACTSVVGTAQRLAKSNLGEMLEIKAPVIVKHKANDGNTYTYLFATRKFHKSKDKFDNNPRPKSLAQETELVCVRTDGSLSSTFKDQEGREVFTNATGNKKGTMLSILKTNDYVLSPGHNTQILTVKNQAGETEEWILYHGYSWDGRKQNLENVKTDRYQLFAEKIEWEEWYPGFPGLTPPTQEPLSKPVVDTEKQKESSYKITNAKELKNFAADVNEGKAHFSNALLMNDIDCSGITSWTPIGAFADKMYHGIIDGQGHQILNLKVSQGENAALVSYAGSGATFKNIIIHSSCSFASTSNCGAAFVAQASGPGTITFEKCGNEANVSAGLNAGAFVGRADNNIQVVINTCYNTGDVSVLGNNGTDDNGTDDNDADDNGAGAFAGDVANCTLKISNSWNNGLVNVLHQDLGHDNGLFANNSTKASYTVTKTYDLKNVSSTSTALAYGKPSGYTDDWYYNGHLTYLLNEEKGSRVWYQKLGEDDHPMLFTRGGDIVYKAMGCDEKHDTKGGFSEGGYTNSSRGASHAYEFELSSTELSKKCKNCSNLYSSLTVPVNAGWLEVSDANQMEMTMDYVNSGSGINAKIKLMNDIDFTSKGTKMYGQNKDNCRYQGHFDGNFKHVKVKYVAKGHFTALFCSVDGASIKDLYVDGSITNNGGYHGAGVVGYAIDPENIEKCLSSLSYTESVASANGYIGGIVAYLNLSKNTIIDNCGFVGEITAPNSKNVGGIAGYITGRNYLEVKNSYVAANIKWGSGTDISTSTKNDNCYRRDPGSKEVTGGQLCYDLNNGQTSKVWKQSIGVQPYPIFEGDDVDMVVDVNNDEKFYYNGIYTRIKNEEKKEYFTPGDWFTICIPYGSAFIEGGEVYSIAGLGKNSENNPSSLKLYSHEQMVAGTPYICRATDNTFKVYYTAAEAKEAGIVNGLWGTFEDFYFSKWNDYETENAGAGVYVLTGNMLKRASSKSGVKAKRAFVVMSKVEDIARDQAGVKMLTLGFEGMEDDGQTAVDEIKTVDITSTPVYNLQGQRVQNPSHGIFIVNGKKVYIK